MNVAARVCQPSDASTAETPVTWHVDEVPWIPLTGLFIDKSGYKTVADAAYTGNAYSIELTSVGPGGYSPTHVEPHAHLFYVLSGHGEVTVGDEVKAVTAGSVSPISAGMPHSFRNLGDSALEMLVVYHPPRMRKQSESAPVRAVVHALRYEAQRVVSVELRPQSGSMFPAFDAGAHVDVHLPERDDPQLFAVQFGGRPRPVCDRRAQCRTGRGGSRYVHEQLRVGTQPPDLQAAQQFSRCTKMRFIAY